MKRQLFTLGIDWLFRYMYDRFEYSGPLGTVLNISGEHHLTLANVSLSIVHSCGTYNRLGIVVLHWANVWYFIDRTYTIVFSCRRLMSLQTKLRRGKLFLIARSKCAKCRSYLFQLFSVIDSVVVLAKQRSFCSLTSLSPFFGFWRPLCGRVD